MASVEELVAHTVAGDTAAWQALQAATEQTIVAMARRHPSLRKKKLASEPDDIAEVLAATLARLAHDRFSNLQSFLQKRARQDGDPSRSDASFDDWLWGAVDYSVREHLRKRFGRAPKNLTPGESVVLSKRDLHSLAGRLDLQSEERACLQTLGMTAKITLAELWEYIDGAFSEKEAAAMRLFYQHDQGLESVAEALGLADVKEANLLIRKLNARLRYRFAETPPDPGDAAL